MPLPTLAPGLPAGWAGGWTTARSGRLGEEWSVHVSPIPGQGAVFWAERKARAWVVWPAWVGRMAGQWASNRRVECGPMSLRGGHGPALSRLSPEL